MLVTEIALFAATAFLLTRGALAVDNHCIEKYDYSFFRMDDFAWLGFAGMFLFVGVGWFRHSVEHHTDTLNGLLLAGAGVAILVWRVTRNFIKTNPAAGAIGTVMQLSAFAAVIAIGVIAGVVWLIGGVILIGCATLVRPV